MQLSRQTKIMSFNAAAILEFKMVAIFLHQRSIFILMFSGSKTIHKNIVIPLIYVKCYT